VKSDPDPETSLARSVVVCCYTEARWERIGASVASAAGQLAAGDELVVVVDHNPSLLKRASEAFFGEARVVANRFGPGLSGARNTGAEEATAPIVVFLDDDAEAAAGWLNALAAPFDDPGVVGTGGGAIPRWHGAAAPWWFPDEFLWVVGCSYRGLPTEKAEVRNPIGCNMAFRAEAIRGVGGFSAALGRVRDRPVGGEETDLAIRIRAATGGVIVHEPAAVVHHAVEPSRATWRYFARRCYHEGRSKAILARRVGPGRATEAERSYLTTLAGATLLRVRTAVRERSLRPLGQAAVIVAGLAVTTFGYVTGRLDGLRRRAA
jgi:GT2 family glycosyltransferase